MRTVPLRTAFSVLACLAGPAAVGAALGIPFGARGIWTESLILPAIACGVAILSLPALYIGMTLLHVAPPAPAVAKAGFEAMRSLGLALLGLAPACLFLLSTSRSTASAWLLGFAVLGFGSLAGLRTLFGTLREGSASSFPRLCLFAAWSVVTLGLGAHFVARSLTAAASALSNV